MSRKLSIREKIILVICVLMGVVYLVHVSVILPLLQKNALIEQNVLGYEVKIKKEQKILMNADTISRKYEHLLTTYQQKGSNDEKMSAILTEIKEAAQKQGLMIADLKPKRVRKQEYFSRFSVSLTLTNEFKETMQFLYELQKGPHGFSVDEIQFDTGSRRRNAMMKTQMVLSKIFVWEE